MASIQEKRCYMCHAQLYVQPKARTVRCENCGAINSVRFRDSFKRGLRVFIEKTFHLNSRASDPTKISSTLRMPSSNSPQLPLGNHSKTQGKKRAVLCGVSYRSKPHELKRTINDVNSMKSFLFSTFRFPKDSIHVLTEYENDPQNIPNRLNIQRELQWLIQGCQPGDSLVFYYSGHGSRLFNFNGDEIDGFDETLCPVDYRTNGMITANELNNTIVRPLPKGAVLHAIIDACHSGTVLDLPYYCSMNREGVYEWAENGRPATGVEKGTNGGLAICLSSCADHQVCADTDSLSGKMMTGAMTYTLIKLLEREPNMTYGFLLNAMRDAVHDIRIGGPFISLIKRVFNFGSPQLPQLTSSERFDIHTKQFTL